MNISKQHPEAGLVMARRLETIGGHILRYGLVALILWFGAFKFTQAEAKAIQPLIAHSPLLSWLYGLTDVRGASRLIGSAEILLAVLIGLRPFSPTLSAIGSLGATGMFLTTLSFLWTTPGMWAHVEGFVVPSEGGAFLVKDIFLLGAAAWSAGEALRARAAVLRNFPLSHGGERGSMSSVEKLRHRS